jgi:uncharacterized protein YkwD
MTPLIACFSGTVFTAKGGNAGHWLTLLGDCGWQAQYMHLNDDRTDADDDTAPREMTYAPWIEDGGHVEAGDLLGFVGNSGNAKTSGSHLHFELHGPQGPVDPAAFLRAALVVESPSTTVRPSSYTAPVFIEKIIERPEPMALAPLKAHRDVAALRFGHASAPGTNIEHVVRVDNRTVATSGKANIVLTWDTKREADGEHVVEFIRRNIVTGNEIVLESRTVLVNNGAIPVRPDVTGERLEMLLALNYYRRLTGLPYVAWDGRLASAALSHTDYWEINKSGVRHSAHNEHRGLQGFSGEMPSDRARAKGYANGVSEVMHFVGARRAVDSLWSVPYHRFALANVSAQHVGIGSSGQTVAISLGMGPNEGVSVFPPDGMTGVPTEGCVSESPAPLRMHRGGGGKVGYVISFGVYSAFPQRIDVRKVELREGGRLVDCYLNTPSNDDAMQTGVIIIPKSPLRALTTFEAYVQAKDSRGRDISRRWRFTTGKNPSESHTMDYRAAVSRAVNPEPGEVKVRGTFRQAAEDGNAISIVVEGGEGITEHLIGSTMWVGMAQGVPVRLGDDPLGIYPVRPDLTRGDPVVVVGKGKAPTAFQARLVVVK